jgi:zinc protease
VDNQPYGRAFETVYANLYPEAHPYHWPVIGSMDDLSAATLDDVAGFFRSYYAPNNASLAIAGNVSEREVRRLAEKYFGEIPAGPPVPEVTIPPSTLSSDRRAILEDDIRLPRLYVAWHAPQMYTDDDAAMDVLASVLTGGRSSRLYRRLVYEDQIAQDVSAFQNSQELAGSFWIIATAKPGGSLEVVEAALREELARLVAEGVDGVELERVVTGIETSFVRSLERVGGFGGKADRLNGYHFFAGTPGFARRDLLRYKAVTDTILAEAARTYLTDRSAVWLSVVPRGRRDLAAPGAPGGMQ